MSTISKSQDTPKPKRNSQTDVLNMVELALLIGIIILMTFTPIGYIPITPGLTVTLIPIPVVIGAIVLGPTAGAILGAVFGLSSFVTCLLGKDVFGVALLSFSPIKTFILCMIPRIIMGLLCGLIFKLMYNKIKHNKVLPFIVSSVSGPLLNTILFMSSLWLLFKDSKPVIGMADSVGATGFWTFIIAFVGLNALIEALVCLGVGSSVSIGIFAYVKKLNASKR